METIQPVQDVRVRPAPLVRGVVHPARKRSSTGGSRHRRRGRPPGIDPEREQALAKLAGAGLTLAQMAAALGVSRQCVHQQLAKCPHISVERRARRAVRRRIEASMKTRQNGLQWVERRSGGGPRLARFLREAAAHGWTVEVAPYRRPRVNGTPLAFHQPRHTRTSGTIQHDPGTRYYHVQLTRPEWLHVVCLPSGRYVFYLPDPARRSGSYYIPVSHAAGPQPWPEWRHSRRARALTGRSTAVAHGTRAHAA
jgi:hypothetical protein